MTRTELSVLRVGDLVLFKSEDLSIIQLYLAVASGGDPALLIYAVNLLDYSSVNKCFSLIGYESGCTLLSSIGPHSYAA